MITPFGWRPPASVPRAPPPLRVGPYESATVRAIFDTLATHGMEVGVAKKKRNVIEAEARALVYDLPSSLVLLLDDYVTGRGDERRCADALAKLTPNQTDSVKAYAADRAAAGFEAAEHLVGMLTSLGVTPAAGRARVRPAGEGQ